MSLFKWKDSYNTGVEQFDQEHHKLVELIDAMYEAVRDKVSKEDVEKLLAELISYTGYHFENEEKAMAAADFPELEEHRQEHEKLKAETQRFQTLLARDTRDGTVELYKFLRDWLMHHILECDMKYSGKISGTE